MYEARLPLVAPPLQAALHGSSEHGTVSVSDSTATPSATPHLMPMSSGHESESKIGDSIHVPPWPVPVANATPEAIAGLRRTAGDVFEGRVLPSSAWAHTPSSRADSRGSSESPSHASGRGAGAARGAVPANAAGVGSGSSTSPLGLHVLAVDDERTNRLVVGRMLSRLGCTYELAEEGDDALALVFGSTGSDGRAIDVVLLDIVMRRTNGLETCAQLRSRGFTASIIATTGNKLLPGHLGPTCFTDVLEKPFATEALRAMLLKHCKPRDPVATPSTAAAAAATATSGGAAAMDVIAADAIMPDVTE